MIEAGATSTGGWKSADPQCCPNCCARCARHTGGSNGGTTEAFTLLISIRFPLENKEAGALHGGVVGAPTL